MAANPNLPPPERLRNNRGTPAVRGRAPFPWGLVAAIIVIICLGLIAYYFFR